jgi:hypothetical protein
MSRPEEIAPPEIVSLLQLGRDMELIVPLPMSQFYGDVEAKKYTGK